jgi:hypothetical protein
VWVAGRGGAGQPASAAAGGGVSAGAVVVPGARASAVAIAAEKDSAASEATRTAPPATAEPSASVSAATAEVPAEAPGDAVGASDGKTGTIVTGSTSGQHRVYVDGHVVGEGEGTFTVACGTHVVRIGSAGREQTVVVPCGGSAEVR